MNDMLAPRATADATDDTIGGRISLARDAINLSVEQISAIAGVTEETWISWENDRAEPRANRLDMMAGILQVNIAWLLDGRGTGPVESR
ncbi:helix-turn-helix domain-containing protein [Ensifer sp. ZNC0028]|uniref:helix-turn-helix domain-containing protein n=1 Tax=unclassified Ensifer TaxID=2633371 RepID=UPI000A77EBE0|nr:helix-turn-helix transcriptional regulator [Ensifer sp. ZNC0028]